ncbi:MAG TPA: L,D-transpeptidase family protein [Solirubrobacteraceae bacterium]|jgi:lipoprotein-anchoring transpeptidase ErfK/SrfK|nr:L,D-transpeptidase family protein [Solirubrobacteraceae bacterium]
MSATTIAPPPAASSPPGRNRLVIVAAIVVGVLVLLVVAMLLYDHSRRDQIAKGVTIDGVAVGGLSESAARSKIERELIAPLNRPVIVRSGSHTWMLSARGAGLTVDAANMVSQAVSASRQGSVFTRTFRGLFGGSVHRDVPLVVSYSHSAIRGLTAKVRASVNKAPRDATVAASGSGLTEVAGENGMTVDNDRLGGRITRALASTGRARTVAVPAHVVKPKVTTSQLASQYPAYIIIDRSAFRLRLYTHLKLASTYEIAVGMEGLETPAGLHHIEWKQVDPPWYVPKKAWAGALAGTVVPPGPGDPLKARFMSFEGGAGIHGIDPSEYSSIGHDASHGCVRMRIPDVIALYDKTPVGTPVYIA